MYSLFYAYRKPSSSQSDFKTHVRTLTKLPNKRKWTGAKVLSSVVVVSLAMNFAYAAYNPSFREFMSSRNSLLKSVCNILFDETESEANPEKIYVEKLAKELKKHSKEIPK